MNNRGQSCRIFKNLAVSFGGAKQDFAAYTTVEHWTQRQRVSYVKTLVASIQGGGIHLACFGDIGLTTLEISLWGFSWSDFLTIQIQWALPQSPCRRNLSTTSRFS